MAAPSANELGRREELEGYHFAPQTRSPAVSVVRHEKSPCAPGPKDAWKLGEGIHICRKVTQPKPFDAAREAWIKSLDEEARAKKEAATRVSNSTTHMHDALADIRKTNTTGPAVNVARPVNSRWDASQIKKSERFHDNPTVMRAEKEEAERYMGNLNRRLKCGEIYEDVMHLFHLQVTVAIQATRDLIHTNGG